MPCRYMAIGEWPGKDEARSGRVFSGKTGRELDRYLDGIRLPARHEWFLTTWIREWCGEDADYTQADWDRDLPALVSELKAGQPEIIVTLGRNITRYFLGDVDLDETFGIPWRVSICYECLSHTRKLLVASSEDIGRLLDLARAEERETGRIWSSLVPRPNVGSSHSGLYADERNCTGGASARSHLPQQGVCESGAFGASVERRESASGENGSNDVPTRTSQNAGEHIHSAGREPRLHRLLESAPCCPRCGKPLSELTVFAGYNPAAGFKSPEISARVSYQFAQLEGVLDGSLTARKLYDDPIPDPDYHVIETVEELDEVMIDATQIATDSEGYPWAPWSVQITVRSGESFVLRVRRREDVGHVVERFAFWVNTCGDQYSFTFHNALHDLAVFRAIGVCTERLKFNDTMLMAYALQLEPQGLKPLCGRHCGMKMEHYDEVMGNASHRLAVDWLSSAQLCEGEEYETRCQDEFIRLTTTPYTDKKGNLKPGRRLTKIPELPRTALHKSIERCLKSKRPRGLWDDQVIDLRVEAESKYGPMWEATLDNVPVARAIGYAGRDSDGTHRLFPQLAERVRANDLWDVYQADLHTVPLIDRMQQIGVRPDLEHFVRLSGDLRIELQGILDSLSVGIERATEPAYAANIGDVFNPNSGAQTADLLFGRFGIQSLKRTAEGDPSTNDKVLEALEKDGKISRVYRDIIADIRLYREVYKLKSTFVDKIPDFVNRWPYDGRIHSTFRITRVVTGRLAASDPNLLALPKHGKFAKRFRSGFVSGDSTFIASWDLSQIELRVLAHLSQDPVLLHAFRTGVDLHATLAQRIFGVDPKDQDKSKHRLPAKAVNFGIPMGMTAIGLCLELRKNGVDVDEDDAQRWLNETMALYAKVPEYQQNKIAEARRYGFVTDIRGRRRYIGGIHSWDQAIRSEAERFAFSTPIQAGAQEVMKEAEAYVYSDILLPAWSMGDYVEPLVQIHDDLVLELDRRLLLKINDWMVYAMTKVPAHWLSVPIETSGDYGTNWGDMVAVLCPKCKSYNETFEHKHCRMCGAKID